MASAWVCLVLVFRQGYGFSRAGLAWKENETLEYCGGGGRPTSFFSVYFSLQQRKF